MDGARAPSTQNDEVTKHVTFASYNSTGLDIPKSGWINSFCNKHEVDYLTIQEHFRNAKATDKFFRDRFSEFNSYVIPGHRSEGQDTGRPQAGLAQLSRKCLAVKKDRVVTSGFRVQAQVLNLPNRRILWINTYLPCDTQRIAGWDDSELRLCLIEVEGIILNTNHTDLVWGSDLNWDMSRRTQFSGVMKEFMNKLDIVPLWTEYEVDFTHIHTDYKTLSTIDHFVVSRHLLPSVVECRVIHSGDNRSRHSPIILKLNLGNLPVRSEIKSKKIRRPAWSRVTQQEAAKYTEALDSRLQALHLPASMKCSDPCCKDSTHSEERDSFVLDILCQLVECSHTVLPLTGGRDRGGGTRGNPIPGWKEEAEPQRERSIYWHNVWMKEGRPSQGWLHDTMVKTRTQFHHAVRRLKARCKEVKAKKLFEASVHGEQSLMSEMKNIRHGGTGGPAELPENVAGANGEDEIVDKF